MIASRGRLVRPFTNRRLEGKPRARRVLALAYAAAVVFAGCRHQPPTSAPGADRAPSATARSLPFPSPPRSFVLPNPDAKATLTDRDGTEHYLVQGMRVTLHADGRIERGATILATGGEQVTQLPERLGGGYLFRAGSSGVTRLWRAGSWAGELQPLAQLGFDVDAVHPGFDRLYAVVRASQELIALDPDTGALVELGPLPRAPGVRQLAFADSWLGLADVPYRGALVTFDAGASWHPLGLGILRSVAEEAGQLRVVVDSGAFLVAADGRVARLASGEPAGASSPAPEPRAGDVARARAPSLLREVVLGGWPEPGGSAVAVVDGDLVRVRLADGELLARARGVIDRGARCSAAAIGDGFGFVCGGERRGTTIHAFRPPLALTPVFTFASPRFVAPGGTGALAVRGPCREALDARETGVYCIVAGSGDAREIRVRGDRGVERVVALRSGEVVVLVPPRLGAPGELMLVPRAGAPRSVPLRLPELDEARRRIVQQGLWLEGFRETATGQLAGWVAAGGSFVGVRVTLDGKVTAGEQGVGLERTLLAGPFGLTMHRTRGVRESTDGGFSWRDAEVPLDLETLVRQEDAERGCSVLGCAAGGWLRVGWQGRRGAPDPLAEATPPAPSAGARPEGSRWLLQCSVERVERAAAAGRGRSSPAGRSRPDRDTPPTPDAIESSAWLPFAGVAPPPLPSGVVGLDQTVATATTELHAYAWGARGVDWQRAGTWLVRARDPFARSAPVWSTAPTLSPWPDVVSAAQAFGLETGGRPAPSWGAALEPGGAAAILALSAATGREYFLLEAGRAIRRLPEAGALGVSLPSGVVRVGGQYHFGADRETFRVFVVAGERLRLVGDYPELDASQQSPNAVVVRNARGDALGLWVRALRTRGASTAWYIHEIDTRTGALEAPLVLEPRDLARVPRACEAGDDGWVLVGALPLTPWIELTDSEVRWTPRRVDARLLASPRGLCVDAFTVEGELPPAAARPVSPRSGAVPFSMIAVDRDQPQRRALLRCTG